MASCTTVPPDTEVCKRLPSKKGYCFRVQSLQERYITEAAMEYYIYKGVVITPEEYAGLKKFILKFCEQYGSCKERIETVKAKMRAFDRRAGIRR